MTKKHFEAMAAKLRKLMLSAAEHGEAETAAGIILAGYAFCDVAEEFNERFNRDRFAAAAGLHCYAEWAEDARRRVCDD